MMDALLVNGAVGVGKSTTASAVAASERSCPIALIDVDEVRRFWPAPADDPFHHRLTVANLRALASEYRRAGAQRLVLAGVVEDRASAEEYREALGVDRLLLCRLTAAAEVVRHRLESRHADDPAGLAWHVDRAVELHGILERAGLDDVVLDVSRLRPDEAARSLRASAGWD
ncbi:hypothetical protein AS850_09775 [Frondihabitans sp. 762G35]|uniref:hypothetical protein n=1 Tax=Frondihabitans sp. 762G35 TaxID=1446794 RepID=UPI000D203126|nr:hypothetical protein [Frondihabitans sp. 762G35]ARC57363.1 hypothetical protein AS850_09775 [Frondihabitans sp. 762G35]